MLYLVFGFLEWYESDDSTQPRLAPLIVLPVSIERTGGKGRGVETVLEYSGEDLENNISLVEKMRRDFGLEIPLLEEEDTPDRDFERFSELLRLKKSWSIRRNLTLALLSFGKLLMYRDLDPRNWPPDQSIARHGLVRELFEGSRIPISSLRKSTRLTNPNWRRMCRTLFGMLTARSTVRLWTRFEGGIWLSRVRRAPANRRPSRT